MVEAVPCTTQGAGPGGATGSGPGFPGESEIMARAGGENFTVASRLLPARSRRRLEAIYGWSRLVDQLGDAYTGDRLDALDRLDASLGAALAARRAGTAVPAGTHPLVAAVADVVAEMGTGEAGLRDLIEANRLDQRTTAYATFADLRDYCRLSARPVGRLVLAAFDVATPERLAWSDDVCDGLQLVEHWQDLAEDLRAGRVYLPGEDLERFGVDDVDLATAAAGGKAGTALRALVGFETARARSLLLAGAPLVGSLRGRDRIAVAGFVAGGLATVDALAAARFDPFALEVRPSRRRTAAHAAALVSRRCGVAR